jgi:hypothetical protein
MSVTFAILLWFTGIATALPPPPTPPAQSELQREIWDRAHARAQALSAAAEAELVAFLGTLEVQMALNACCSSFIPVSKLRTPEALLELILSEMDVAELVHNFPAVWAAASPLSHRPADVRLTHDARPPIALAR